MEVLPYGATITDLQVPDRNGTSASVVLGYASEDNYRSGTFYLGATVGRIAGRLTGGRFTLNGREYRVECNNGPNHLHGGSRALDKRVWHVVHHDSNSLTLGYRSPDGEEGYPGNVDLEVQYRLVATAATHDLIIQVRAATDAPTPLSTTNHAYFNLSGGTEGTVDNHRIAILAERYVPVVDEHMTLADRVVPVEGTPADLREEQPMGEAIFRVFRQHGDNYVYRVTGEQTLEVEPRARVVHQGTGRVMEVLADASCVQFFGGHYLLPDPPDRNGVPLVPRGGFCLECQGYPNGPNCREIDDIIVSPGETYCRTTIYRFSTIG